ncbi:hypothetical protein AAHK20_01115 [Trinickia sp. YCB016]
MKLLPFSVPPRVAVLIALVVAVDITGTFAGYYAGYRHASAQGAAALARQEAAQALAARERERALNDYAASLAAQLLEARRRHASEAQDLKRRIDHVTDSYRPAPDAPLHPLPACVFTAGFVGVYNAAIDAGPLPEADAAAVADGAPGAAETLDSGVRQRDVLAHLIDYGQRCRGIEAQLNRVLAWVQEEVSQ